MTADQFFHLRRVPCGAGDAIVVELLGDALASGAHQLNSNLLETLQLLQCPNVVIDMQSVEICVSETVNALLRSRELVESWNGHFRLAEVTPGTRQVLETLGLANRIFMLDQSVQDSMVAIESAD